MSLALNLELAPRNDTPLFKYCSLLVDASQLGFITQVVEHEA